MSKTSKNRKHILVLIGFLAYPVLLADATRILEEFAIHPISAPGWLTPLKAGMIALSIFALITPWLIHKRMIPLRPRPGSLLGRMNPATATLITGYLFVTSPVVYGLILFFLGMPSTEFYYFAGMSVVGAVVWGIYNWRQA